MEHKYIDLDLPSGTLWLSGIDEVCNDDIVKFNVSPPTKEDYDELIDNTYHGYDRLLNGIWFVSKKDVNKRIFFVADVDTDIYDDIKRAGYNYWISSEDGTGSYTPYLRCSSYNDDRIYGFHLKLAYQIKCLPTVAKPRKSRT